MRVRFWSRDLGLAICVVVAVSFVQLSGQGPARRFIAVDLVGNLSPGVPPGAQWPVRFPPGQSVHNLALGANGNILYTGSTAFSLFYGEFVSIPNNTTGVPGVIRFNNVGGAEEIVAPDAIADGACWSGQGTCQYVADRRTCSIYQRDATGSIQRIVGTGMCLPGSAPPPALLVNGSNRLEAQFGSFSALGFTAAEGLVFGACTPNRTAIYRAVPGLETIEYLAGTGVNGAGTSGPATATAIGCPGGPIVSALAPLGNETQIDGVAFALPLQNVILRVTSGGQLDRLAGTGALGATGDDGPATSATLFLPLCVVRDKTAYEICDTNNNRIRRVDNLTGLITTVAGNGSPGTPVHGGAALTNSAGQARAIAIDAAGNRYTVDQISGQVGVYAAATSIYSVLFRATLENYFSPISNLPANESPVTGVTGIARIDGPAGLEGLLLSDTFFPRVLRWDASTNRVTTFAGGGPFPTNTSPQEGIPANQSFLFFPADVVRTPDGVTYISDPGACRISKVDAAGIITTAIGRLGECGAGGDGGPATNATIGAPWGMALAPDGRLFWSDGAFGTIRQMAANGTVSRVAGNGTPGFSGDGGPALDAQLSAFSDIDVSPDGRFLFISDFANHAIRAVDLSLNPPMIATIAGTGGMPGNTGDGGPANQAKLFFTEGVSMSGNLLAIADQDNHRIRMVTFPPNANSLQQLGSGIITTIFGTGARGRLGRGVADAVNARTDLPYGLAPLKGPERGWFYSEQGGLTVGKLIELGAPNAPSGFTANVSGNSVTMGWTPPDVGAPATSYRVLARLTAGGPVVAQGDLTDPTLIVDHVPNGTYLLSVRGSNSFGDGPESSQRTVTVPQAHVAAGAPRNLSSSVVGSTVTLRWQVPATGGAPTQYAVVPSLTPGGTPITIIPINAAADPQVENPQVQVTSFTAASVPNGTYYVRLYASNPGTPGSLSPPSNEVVVVVAPPNAPVMNAPVKSGTTVTFSWTPAAGPVAQSYLLTAALSPNGPTIASVTTTTLSFTATGVPAGTYYIRVRAVSTAGQSAQSNEVTLTIP